MISSHRFLSNTINDEFKNIIPLCNGFSHLFPKNIIKYSDQLHFIYANSLKYTKGQHLVCWIDEELMEWKE
jgi:phosphoribosylformylglycinamidine (FGAM) synthase-like amidotransferase family enzyme